MRDPRSMKKRIGAELGISENTVKVHPARIMEKMLVRSVAELVRLCDTAEIGLSQRRKERKDS